jgi:hypothetical protein
MRNGAKIQILLTGCNFCPLGVPNGTRGQKRPLVSFNDLMKSLPEKVLEFPDKKQARVFVLRKETLFLLPEDP